MELKDADICHRLQKEIEAGDRYGLTEKVSMLIISCEPMGGLRLTGAAIIMIPDVQPSDLT